MATADWHDLGVMATLEQVRLSEVVIGHIRLAVSVTGAAPHAAQGLVRGGRKASALRI